MDMHRRMAEENERDIEAIFGNIDILLWYVKERDKGELFYEKVNNAFASVAGITPEEYNGKPVSEMGRGFKAIQKRYKELKATGEMIMYERSVDDDTKHFVIRLIPVADSDGEIRRFIGSAIDITERKEREEKLKVSQERFERMAENIQDGLIIVEGDDVIYVNKRMCEITGYTKEELMRMELFSNALDEDKRRIEEIKDRFLNDTEYIPDELEFRIIKKNGEKICTLNRFSKYYEDKNVINKYIITTDITEKKFNEKIQDLIYEIANLINTVDDLEELFGFIRKRLGEILDVRNFYIALYDAKTDKFEFKYSHITDEEINFSSFPADKSITSYLIKEDRPLLLREEELDGLIKSGEIRLIGMKTKAWLGVPLKIGGRTVGAMVILNYYDENAYSEKDLMVLKFISEQIAIAIDKKKSEEALRNSEKKFRKIFELSPATIVLLNNEGTVIEVNDRFEKILDYDKEVMLGKKVHNLSFLTSEAKEKVIKAFNDRMSGEEVPSYEIEFIKRDGERGSAMVSGTQIYDEMGKIMYGLAVISDITELKKTQDELKSLLSEKDILIKEIHHRVKNNLQIVSSILNIQAHSLKNEDIIDSFKKSHDRISSIALVHEKLYNFANLSRINFKEYINELANSIYNAFKESLGEVKLKTDIEDITIDINKAIPISLIINELLINSMKYAFPNQKSGRIYLNLKKEEDFLEIIIGDDGIGLPDTIDIHNPETIGLDIVNILVEQIDGSIELNNNNGTEFLMKIKI
jgi:PAS domain S-box-containing protein